MARSATTKSGLRQLHSSERRRLRKKVYRRDGFKCVYCNEREFLTLDHRLPVSKGGTNEFDNLETVCERCNEAKGAL